MASQLNQDQDLWTRRMGRRTDAVHRMKNLEIYKLVSMVRMIGGDAGAPRTPNPEDRSLSKRHWEKTVFQWRKEQYTYCNDRGYTTATMLSSDASFDCVRLTLATT